MHIFVSYAREDKRWLDPDYRYNLVPYLMESLRRSNADVWFDKELVGGDEFKLRIESEIDRAQIALLLVSQHFLNSEFIETFELPRIAARAARNEMVVIPVLVEPCAWLDYPFLADRQMVPSSSPLIHYTESEAKWADVRFEILDGLRRQVKRIRDGTQAESLRREADERLKRDRELDDEKKRKAREEADRKAQQDAERREAEQAALRKEVEEHKRREQEFGERLQKEAAEQRAREDAERKRREEEKQKAREEGRERKFDPLSPVRSRKLLVAAAAACLIVLMLLADVAFHHWFAIAGAKWTVSKTGVTSALFTITGSGDGRTLYSCGGGSVFLASTDGGVTWVDRKTGGAADCDSIFTSADGKQIWTPATTSHINALPAAYTTSVILQSSDGGQHWKDEVLFNLHDSFYDYMMNEDESRNTAPASSTSTPGSSPAGSSPSTSSRTLLTLDSTFTAQSTAPAKKHRTTVEIRGIFGTPDGKQLWAAGEGGEVYRSTDGGDHWTPVNTSTVLLLNAISGSPDGLWLYAVGLSGTIIAPDPTTRDPVASMANWKTAAASTTNALNAVFVSDNGMVVCIVGDNGAIVTEQYGRGVSGSSGTSASLRGVFGTGNGKHLWAVGNSGTILESDNSGETWTSRPSGTSANLRAIFGTSDGKHLWVAAEDGTVLESKASVF